MKDIAKRCGVSTATVSKALNGQPDIGEETRERIVRIADEMGYMANASARALKTNRSYNIGVVFVDPMHGGLAHEFFSTVLDGIRSEAECHGYDITFINQNVGRRQTASVWSPITSRVRMSWCAMSRRRDIGRLR